MSLVPNAYGNFLSNAIPFMANYAATGAPWGITLKPGGRVAAYVRSTGAQDGDDLFASSGNLVGTINEGLKRCRSGQNDIVVCLPGHTETYSSSGAIWANLVAGAQIIGACAGASNAPTINLGHVGASIALNVADVTLCGFNIRSSAVLTAGVVITGAGVTFACNSVISSGALAANSLIAVTGAANCSILNNNITVDSTATVIAVTGAASTNFVIQNNFVRQTQATTGGSMSTTASTTGISGMYANNFYKTATTGTAGAGVIVLGANTITTVGNFENYGCDETAAAALLVTGAA